MSIEPVVEEFEVLPTEEVVVEKGWVVDPTTGEKRFSDYGLDAESKNPGHEVSPIWVD